MLSKIGVPVRKAVTILLVVATGVACASRQRPLTAFESTQGTSSPQPVCVIKADDDFTVRQLVEMLSDDQLPTVQFAFDNLLMCAPSIRASLVRQLDNRTPMTAGPVLILNRMPHFELFAQYGPQQVIDAVALILGDPGNSPVCSGLMNGGTNEQRDNCVAAWRGGRNRSATGGPQNNKMKLTGSAKPRSCNLS
jgi:hypothetical protein